jgi:hypothetical protein
VFASKEIILDMFFRPAVFSFSCVLTIDRTLTSLFPDAFVLEILNYTISKITTGQALYLYQCNFLFFLIFFPLIYYYRPISPLSSFRKYFEGIIFKEVFSYKYLFYKYQCEFIPCHSTRSILL